jgi:hypothetical protein
VARHFSSHLADQPQYRAARFPRRLMFIFLNDRNNKPRWPDIERPSTTPSPLLPTRARKTLEKRPPARLPTRLPDYVLLSSSKLEGRPSLLLLVLRECELAFLRPRRIDEEGVPRCITLLGTLFLNRLVSPMIMRPNISTRHSHKRDSFRCYCPFQTTSLDLPVPSFLL